MKLSLAITTYNRVEMTIKSFSQVIHDERIDDIVISDDASTDGAFIKLTSFFCGETKVRVIGRSSNVQMSRNKFEAIGYSRNPWVIILDSDNVIGVNYLDSLENVLVDEKTIYLPSFSEPTFDYRKFSGILFNRNNVKEFIEDPVFQMLLNTCNYVVPRDEYCRVYKEDKTVKESDTLYFAHLWLEAGNRFHVVDGLKYFHRVHEGSGWLKNAGYNMARGKQTVEQIKAL